MQTTWTQISHWEYNARHKVMIFVMVNSWKYFHSTAKPRHKDNKRRCKSNTVDRFPLKAVKIYQEHFCTTLNLPTATTCFDGPVVNEKRWSFERGFTVLQESPFCIMPVMIILSNIIYIYKCINIGKCSTSQCIFNIVRKIKVQLHGNVKVPIRKCFIFSLKDFILPAFRSSSGILFHTFLL